MLASEAFGKKLRELRIAQELTQQQLAEQVYVSRYTVSNWEGGKRLPDVSTISRLARCLKVEDRVLYESMREQENAPNIIVVEDVPVILRNFVHTLSRELPKAQVWGFATAEEALAFARLNHVGVAFLDIELCGEDGMRLAEALLSLQPRINIIFLTSHAEYMANAFALHCSGYLMKPLTPEKIRSEISHLRFPVQGLTP